MQTLSQLEPEIKSFLKEAVHTLETGGAIYAKHNLDDDLALFVGYVDYYNDAEDYFYSGLGAKLTTDKEYIPQYDLDEMPCTVMTKPDDYGSFPYAESIHLGDLTTKSPDEEYNKTASFLANYYKEARVGIDDGSLIIINMDLNQNLYRYR